jgi:DNA-binding response OmpR family regulator
MADSPRRILYVDDDADTRDLVVLTLTAEGFQVTAVEFPHEFLDEARRAKYGLYILDNWMPELSGFELANQVRQFDKQTPILFYSAAAAKIDRMQAVAAGAESFLAKPASTEDLVAAVDRLLEQSVEGSTVGPA